MRLESKTMTRKLDRALFYDSTDTFKKFDPYLDVGSHIKEDLHTKK